MAALDNRYFLLYEATYVLKRKKKTKTINLFRYTIAVIAGIAGVLL